MAQKTTFFSELSKLDESEEETEDPEDAAVILRQFKPLHKPCQSEKGAPLGRETPSFLSSSSAVQASSFLIQSPSQPSRRRSQVIISSSSCPLKIVKSAKVTPKKKKGKRKRAELPDLLPDSQQIFKGLQFCMISPTLKCLWLIQSFVQTSFQIMIYRRLGDFGLKRQWNEVLCGCENGGQTSPIS